MIKLGERPRKALIRATNWLPAKTRVSLDFFYTHNYWPNFRNPSTFSEKVVSRKVGPRNAIFPQHADKVAARKIVETTLGSEFVVDLYGVYEDVESLLSGPPEPPFVLKASHDSGSVLFVRDEDDLSPRKLKEHFNHRLRRKFGVRSNEWWYWPINPVIVAEELLIDEREEIPRDYKFFVFDGIARVIQVDKGRFEQHSRNLYTRDWEFIDGRFKHPNHEPEPSPEYLQDMLQAAEILGAPFDFVRVDFYSLPNRPALFGEFTFAPDAGYSVFRPEALDLQIGKLWDLE